LTRPSPQIRRSLGVQADAGAVVLAVQQGSPADVAGVRPGDVIVGLADRDVDTVEDLLGALRATEPGQQTPLAVIRGGERRELTVTIGTGPS
jgi:S1-C subfamily serine protease